MDLVRLAWTSFIDFHVQTPTNYYIRYYDIIKEFLTLIINVCTL